MGALAVSQLLENAQDKGVEIALETAAVENQVSSCSSIKSVSILSYSYMMLSQIEFHAK